MLNTVVKRAMYCPASISSTPRASISFLIQSFRLSISAAASAASASNSLSASILESKVKGSGYTCMRVMSEQERALPQVEREDLEKRLSCFVPCNAKATNIYRNRWALAYCVNMYFNPMIRRFFTDGNDERTQKGLSEIYPDENMYALSCLIQWMFRSRIRDGKHIYIYIPNKRMRQLLFDWMNCKI